MRTVNVLTQTAVTSYQPSQRHVDQALVKSTTVYLGWRSRQNILYWYCLKGNLDYILAGKYVDRNGKVKTSNRGNLYIEGTPIANKVLLPRRHFLARAVHRLYDPDGVWWNLVEQTYNYNKLLSTVEPEILDRLGIKDVPSKVDPLLKHLGLCKHLLKEQIKRQSEGLLDSDALKIDINQMLKLVESLTWPVLMKTPQNNTNFQYDLEICNQDRAYQICC